MDKEKYKNLIETLPKESEELWFEYNLEVNKILQENKKYKEVIDKTIEYNRELSKLYDVGSMERSNADTNLLILGDKETIKKLKWE